MDLLRKLGLMLVVDITHTAANIVLQRSRSSRCNTTEIGQLEALRARAVRLLGINPVGNVIPLLTQLLDELESKAPDEGDW